MGRSVPVVGYIYYLHLVTQFYFKTKVTREMSTMYYVGKLISKEKSKFKTVGLCILEASMVEC